ncbi:MAG: hypothetical protein EOP89_08705 [Lysobacteraceae bacterium]|nr:MAG: hypothetical protein EOP89_08705 [Xanthomonadaceae bacterium]
MTGLGMPAVLLDRSGRVGDANALMTPDLIDTRGGGRLVLGNPTGDAALAAILDGASVARSIALPPTATRPGRVAHIIPLSRASQDIFGGSFWLLTMNIAHRDRRQPDLAILRAWFDLSPAEGRLAAALAGGSDLAHSAQACGIRPSTARSYSSKSLGKRACTGKRNSWR